MALTDFVTSIFPPPRSLLRPALGIDISDSVLKYLAFERAKDRLQVAAHGSVPLAPQIVVDGIVEKPDMLALVIQEVCKKTGFSHVHMSLPEEHAYVFETSIPTDIRADEARDMVALRLEENVPLPLAEAVFDYEILPANGGDEYPVVVTAYSRRVVDGYLEACHLAEATPLLFEVESQSAARAMVLPAQKDTHMIVDFGASRTGVGIVEKGVLRYTSTIDRGSRTIYENLLRQEKELTQEEFIQRMNTIGLTEGATSEAVLLVVASIKEELLRRIDYWNVLAKKEGREEIASIIFCGGAANIRGLTTYFDMVLDTPAVTADVWQNAFSIEDTIPELFRTESLAYAQAIGLALAGYIKT